MKKSISVLISGASIAGPVLAYWLNRYGFKVTVVERSPELRLGGQNIDIQGAARTVIGLMGLEQSVRDASTTEEGLSFVDENGVSKAEFPVGSSRTSRGTKELEILRGELAHILHHKTAGNVEYIFDDQIIGLDEHDDVISIDFAKGSKRDFDLVIAADGIRSRTRKLILKEDAEIRSLGMYCAYFSIPKLDRDNNWWRWYNATNSRSIHLRPDNQGTIRASVWFVSKPMGYEELSQEDQKKIITQKFAGAGWEAERVVAALQHSKDMYFENLSQLHASKWSRGRGVIVGDCAYGPSPLTGMGTSLAIVGAYVLAGELARHSEHQVAFDAYEKLMRPYVDMAQKIPRGIPKLSHPKSKVGIWLLHKIAKLASKKIFTGGNGLGESSADDISLPDYLLNRESKLLNTITH